MSQDILKRDEIVIGTTRQQCQRSKAIRDISAELREETQLLRFEVDECLKSLGMAMKARRQTQPTAEIHWRKLCLQITLAEVAKWHGRNP